LYDIMRTPAIPPERLFLPGLLMMAPLVAVVVCLVFGRMIEPWAVAMAAILPPVGAVWVALIYHREVRTVSGYLRRLTEAPGTAADPGPDEGDGIAHDLMARIARLDRANASRTHQLVVRVEVNEAILEALPDPLVLIGGERRVRHANQAARALFGDRMVDVDLTLSLRHPEVVGAVDAVLGGSASRTVEFPLPGPVECIYQARIKPFLHRPAGVPGGAPGGPDAPPVVPMVLLSLHDITTIKRSEQSRADFVANASHELRTPLATLIGFIETLRGPARDDQPARERFLGIMHDQSTRMARLVDDLLSLSRIELDEHTRPTGRVDVVRSVGAAVAAFELKAAARKVRLRVLAADDLPMVVGDADQLSQVMHNLISNGIKYTQEQTEVTVTIKLTDATAVGGTAPPVVVVAAAGTAGRRPPRPVSQMISIAVTDQGEGIARTHLPRLTERFYRVDPARSRALGGTGLGLAIVKHILNRHRGRLTIESEVGRGSTFTVWLPVVP
jgi:two-component system phosphate regulon sensor histidine kinase PhoR